MERRRIRRSLTTTSHRRTVDTTGQSGRGGDGQLRRSVQRGRTRTGAATPFAAATTAGTATAATPASARISARSRHTAAAGGAAARARSRTRTSRTAESTGDHWVLGSSPFLPTPRGSNPSPASIERRYWQNLAAGNSAEWLGPDNLARLAEGKPPARVNRRTGRTEQLQAPPLNEPGDEHDAPRWPAQAVDPFARADR